MYEEAEVESSSRGGSIPLPGLPVQHLMTCRRARPSPYVLICPARCVPAYTDSSVQLDASGPWLTADYA